MSNTARVVALLEQALAILNEDNGSSIDPAPARPKTGQAPKAGETMLTGRVGRPTFTTTEKGLSLWKAGIGVTDDEGEIAWVNVQGWRAVADQAYQYQRGDEVTVWGKYSTNTYTDRNGVEQSNEIFTVSRIE